MRRQIRTNILVLCAAVVPFLASVAVAQDVSTTIDLTYDYGRIIDDDAVTDVTTNELKQKYQLEIKAPLTIKFETSSKAILELDFKTETEKRAETKVTPSLEIDIKSVEMEGKAGLKYINDHFKANVASTVATEQVTKTKKQWDNYVEYKFKEDVFPDLTAKYTYKTDEELGVTDKIDKELTGTLDHDIGDLKIKLEYKDTRNDDRIPDKEDKVTTEAKAEGTYKTNLWNEIIKAELSYIYDDKEEETFLDNGDLSKLVTTNTHTAEGKLKATLEPLTQTKVEPEYNYKYIRDIFNKTDEINQTMKAVITQGFLNWIELKGTGERKIIDKQGAETDAFKASYKTEDTFSGEMKGTYAWWLDVNGKYEHKDISEDFAAPATEDTYTRTISWEANWKAKWLDLLDPSLSYSRKQEYEHEDYVLKSTEDKAKGKFDVSFGSLLKIEPNYEWTLARSYDTDTTLLTKDKTTGDFKIKVTADKDLSNYTNVKFSHQYGHKTETADAPGEPTAEVISIDEDTKASVIIQDIWPGFKTTAEFTRKATDKNDDDEELKVDLTYALKLDGAFDRWKYNSTLNYDNKGGGDADILSVELKVDWQYDELKLGGSYKLTHTFATDEKLGKDEHKAGLTLNYRF